MCSKDEVEGNSNNGSATLSRFSILVGFLCAVSYFGAFVGTGWVYTKESYRLTNLNLYTSVTFRIGLWRACHSFKKINSTIMMLKSEGFKLRPESVKLRPEETRPQYVYDNCGSSSNASEMLVIKLRPTPKMLRFLSKKRERHVPQVLKHLKNKHGIQCKVILLDGTYYSLNLSKKAIGNDLYQLVFYLLDLKEKCYFGLQYTYSNNVQYWLDPTEPIKQQLKIGPPYTLKLKVKYYSWHLDLMREEISLYQLFLQLKQDIGEGKLECPDDVAVELAALALQSKLGDCEDDHTIEVISKFKFVPNQTKDMEKQILEEYMKCRGMVATEAEMSYLNKAKCLEMYGIDNGVDNRHTLLGKDGCEYPLRLTYGGVEVYRGLERKGLLLWRDIIQLDLKKEKLILTVENDEDRREYVLVFRLHSEKACKHLRKCAVIQQNFVRIGY